ncbi:MAG: rubredoxin-like domain-containing protein [Candidatus Zixiibacteriota bacterium]
MQWVCEICGYVHEEDELPVSCPVCGAPRSKFSEWIGEESKLLTDETVDDDINNFEQDLFGDYEE